ncbi:MAG: type II toxin-antitoxin system VapC family toxin [Nitrospirae bacterium]|nr:MAG: type II toxin-antitoxin system VapC family toxin [Nitrospirota bacterium]
MKFMLDTNICIYLIKEKPAAVLRHFNRYHAGNIGISSITLAELEYGVAKSLHVQKNQAALHQFILPLEIAVFKENASKTYGIIRAELEKNGTPIGSMDMLIAAHALTLGVTLVTNNTKEFQRIKRLKVSDWTV